jgi:uncharacterized membrane protein YuzA (DUF378 family)
MPCLTIFRRVSLYLSILGALNWGLVGIADFNLVTYLLGVESPLIRFVYLLIGFSGLFLGINTLCWKSEFCSSDS